MAKEETNTGQTGQEQEQVQEVDEAQAIIDNNLRFYNQGCEVPQDALKKINAGRLRGMSDVNPMWRMKRMTEIFGPCGIGWRYEIVKQWSEEYIHSSLSSRLPEVPFREEEVENGNVIRPAIPPTAGVETRSQQREVKCFCHVNLYVKDPETGKWSEPIPGIGGSTLVAQEKNGAYFNDEGYKMALTDALSIAMKPLGIGGNIWYGPKATGHNESKYEQDTRTNSQEQQMQQAIAEMNAVKNRQEYDACWHKWANAAPAICVNGSAFYNATLAKAQKLK